MSDKAQLATLIDMAAGRIPADLLIINCKVVNVFDQTLMDGPLAIGCGKVIGCGDYQAKQILDAKGGYVMPGLIDGHVHIESSSLTPPQFARCILPHGTTTVIADPHEIANVCGLDGIRYMLDSSRDLPLNVRVMLPSCVPATPFEQAGAILEAEDLEQLIDYDGVLGLGEVMDYPSVINHAPSMMNKIMMARRHDRVIDGHSPGMKGKDLTAYVMSGVMTDHECSRREEMLERLRLGMYILLREGSTCKDLLNLIPEITPANSRRCVMCTDDREPSDILSTGHINKSLRLAVEAGLDPLMAISMATLNAAECFRLRHKGALGPGYDADILIVDNLEEFNAKHVFTAGKEIARDGKMLVELPNIIPDSVRNTVRLAPLTEDNFKLPLTSNTVRAIGVKPRSVVTQNLELPVVPDAQGLFTSQLNPGLNKLAVIERHHATGNMGLGVLANYGLQGGAIAISVAHDSHNIVVVGDNDADMLTAVKDVEAMGGGFTLCREGKILAHLPLPVGGLMSDKSAQEVAEQIEHMLKLAHAEFHINENIQPLMTLVFMTLPVIPTLKLTSTGLFDVVKFQPVEVCV
ncbi:adenine deaminase [Pragia fontium]|uniref:Adenine deaminase n=1 Tax=Pragia fontium DSM 5563 = ATCC 49100 TaxID=1122977 RepID=A0AAJ4WA89_9GAMM|nr:adenine deaminase [Pragia fontium]SFC74517.1 Adenine deaminase [Pragia fontium DSM 5563 = ATCC 49100]VEJ55722.1 Adenine deaminase [Pragia fontium]